MSDDNDGSGLGNIKEELERAEHGQEPTEDNTSSGDQDDDDEQTRGTAAGTETESDSDTDSTTDPYEDPAFPYSEVSQDARYIRDETDTEWEDARDLEVERVLRKNGVRNVQGREYDDAVYRLAADHPELVAKYVMDARDLDIPEHLGAE